MGSGIMFAMNALRGNKMLRRIYPSEHEIQSAIVEWSTKVFVDHPLGGKVLLRPFLIKITNEGKRSWAQGKKMKAEGLTKGVSDIFIAFPVIKSISFNILNPDEVIRDLDFSFSLSPEVQHKLAPCYHGFWLEIKSKGKKPTKEQRNFLFRMKELDYHSDWKDTVDEGIQAIKDYLGII
jgi:hypothetical protein